LSVDCDIVLTVYNNIELTRACLDSLDRHFRARDRLIIVDNGSDRPTQEFLKEWKTAHPGTPAEILRLEPNQGFLRAANAGLKRSTGKTVCLLSNDTIVTGGWLERMISLLERSAHLGVVNPMSTTFGLYPQPGQTPEDVAQALAASRSGEFVEAVSCVGFCMLIRRQVIERIGYLDEVFADGYFEDSDFCRRAGKAGFGCAIARDAYVWHREHATFKGTQREALFARNRAIFEERWGRPQRQLFILDPEPGAVKAMSDACLRSARLGNWLWVVVPRRLIQHFEVLRAHGNIQVKSGAGLWFLLFPFWLLLTKRKKRIDEVYLNSRGFRVKAGWLRALCAGKVKEIRDEE